VKLFVQERDVLGIAVNRKRSGIVEKIGRNAPCPCGSGKKYKKCCIDNKDARLLQAKGKRMSHWSLEEIDSFSTDEIVSKLRAFGVPFERTQFREDVKKFYSGEELADHWWKEHPITATGFDGDFLWMAAAILWDRLAPEVPSSERLDDMMQQGYQLLEKGDTRKNVLKACNVWLEVWELLKPRFRADMKSIQDAECVFHGMQSLYNWSQDLEMELYNAGLEDPSFFEKRIQYCHEFCDLFPVSDELIIHNMKRAEAEAHFALRREAEGDRLFELLIERFPDNAWGYIGWGDVYAWPILDRQRDTERAVKIYRMGLDSDVKDKGDIEDRLRELEKEE
jgi:hypothetical protein